MLNNDWVDMVAGSKERFTKNNVGINIDAFYCLQFSYFVIKIKIIQNPYQLRVCSGFMNKA